MYSGSDELNETSVIGLTGVNVESNPEMEGLLGVSLSRVGLRTFAYVLDDRSDSHSPYSRHRIHTHSLLQMPKNYKRGLQSSTQHVRYSNNSFVAYLLSFEHVSLYIFIIGLKCHVRLILSCFRIDRVYQFPSSPLYT